MASGAVATSVTNLELGAAVTVLSLVGLLLSAVAIGNLVRAMRAKHKKSTTRRYVTAFVAVLLLIALVRFASVEFQLLLSPKYAPGKTVGFCQVFARGAGIEFSYEVDGVTYTNCNTFHPLSKDEIDVPNGRYSVRYSHRHPEKGRMDFSRRAGE